MKLISIEMLDEWLYIKFRVWKLDLLHVEIVAFCNKLDNYIYCDNFLLLYDIIIVCILKKKDNSMNAD